MNMTPSYSPIPLPTGIRSRTLEGINGLTVHVLEAGFESKGRPCVLLLHGFPELAFSWRKVMPALAEAGYHVLAPDAYVQIKHQIEKTVASSLIYLNSHARDFKQPELRKYLDLYVRGSGGVTAIERVKLMKLLWDSIGSEFGARHELYEVNYSGSHEEIRRFALLGALHSGQAERWKAFADSCMAEYDLDGWTAPDLVNPDDVSVLSDR